jgi:hypothetical protein
MKQQYKDQSVFIWTEVFNCGELSDIVIRSFLFHHNESIHVFGYTQDLITLIKDPRVIPMTIDQSNVDRRKYRPLSSKIDGSFLQSGYEKGHLGTARLWAHLIKNRREDFLIHIDSDLIFLGNAVDDVINALRNGAVLAGSRRMYKNNLNHLEDVGHLPDCVDTMCFGFNRRKVSKSTFPGLIRRLSGQTWMDKVIGRKIIDFFDSISFSLMRKGPVAYLCSPHDGPSGFRQVDSPFMNKILEVRSAVGSGCAFSKGYGKGVPDTYRLYALESYSVYAFYLLGIETGINRPLPGQLESKLKSLDKNIWKVKGNK